MTEDQLEEAEKLKEEKSEIQEELELWEKELTKPSKMGYLQGWNNFHPVKFENKIPDELFQVFRTAAMNHLKLRLAKIDNDFAKI